MKLPIGRLIEEELAEREGIIKEAAIIGIKELCMLVNDKKFRTKRWGTIWGNENYLIKK